MTPHASPWTALEPKWRAPRYSRPVVSTICRNILRLHRAEDVELAGSELRSSIPRDSASWPPSDRQALQALAFLLLDLAQQGWDVRHRAGQVSIRPPAEAVGSIADEKERVRRQELIKRDAQLRRAPVRRFIEEMEQQRVFKGSFVSVFSLMRDGRELASNLARVRDQSQEGAAALDTVIDPYIQFVDEAARCDHTGLRLMDIWRYFRHTWTNQYTSVPGRSMLMLVRDRATPNHAVIGIAAHASPIVQIRERDTWIGWHADTLLDSIVAQPSVELARWLKRVVDRAIDDLYTADFIEDELLTPQALREPTEQVIARLREEGTQQRDLHHRYVHKNHLKVASRGDGQDDFWVARARTHLFRSKRALGLADLLLARKLILESFGPRPSARGLTKLLSSSAGAKQVRKVLRKAKADRVGILMADISVCGAVQPYSALLGGKLVAMLAASPEVVLEYERRYGHAESEIASAMAGRPIVRPARLALLSTTSLYGIGASQYNRIRIPCERLGGVPGEVIEYRRLGRSEAWGTSQYSDETVDSLCELVQRANGGQRVNSIFGEGTSPKLRKVREGLDQLNVPAEVLLRHHRQRIVYGISLVRNTRNFLLGIDTEPDYLIPVEDGPGQSKAVARWWRDRWLRGRIQSDEVLAAVEQHTLVRPIRHGARVRLTPAPVEQVDLFD